MVGEDAGGDLEECAFAGAVLADDSDALAAWEIEANVFEGPEFAVVFLDAEDALEESVGGVGVDVVALSDVAD